MKVLTFSTLFPNNIWQNRCVFTKERILPLARAGACNIKVVAPIPYYPPLKIGRRWPFSQVRRIEVIDGLDVHHPRYIMPPKIGMTSYGLLMFLSVLPTVRAIHRTFRFNLIDAHYVYPDGFAAVLLGRYFGTPVVTTSHGTDMSLYPNLPLIAPLLRFSLKGSSRLIAVCQALKDAMIRLNAPPEKVAVIPNGADPQKFHPLPKEASRKRLDLPGKRMILSVGGLTENKGFHRLIKAIRILIDCFQQNNIFLLIVGEGPFRAQLEGLIASLDLSQHVRLVGAIPHNDLPLWFNAADLFCLCSGREGWPCVLVESLACGIPVVATGIGGIPEIISSTTFGLLTTLSEKDIAETIFRALRTSWDHDRIVNYAQSYTWERIAFSAYNVFRSANGLGPPDRSRSHDSVQ